MYIEPCCCHRQLPALLREHENRVVAFQTSGDVTMQKLMDAVSFMAGREHRLLLVVPNMDVKMERHIRHYVDRGWSKVVDCLVCCGNTATDGTPTEPTEPTAPTAPNTPITIIQDKMIANGLMAFIGAEGTVIVQGDLISEAKPGMRLYVGFFGENEKVIDSFLKAVESKIRIGKKK